VAHGSRGFPVSCNWLVAELCAQPFDGGQEGFDIRLTLKVVVGFSKLTHLYHEHGLVQKPDAFYSPTALDVGVVQIALNGRCQGLLDGIDRARCHFQCLLFLKGTQDILD